MKTYQYRKRRISLSTFFPGIIFTFTFILASVFASIAHAQTLPSATGNSAQVNAALSDPYGRETPRGLVGGLIEAFASGDYGRAAQYLDVSPESLKGGSTGTGNTGTGNAGVGKPAAPASAVKLAQQLQKKLDTSGSLRSGPSLSNDASGNTNDGLPIDQERIGSLNAIGGEFPLLARRISPVGAAPYWVVSAQSLASVAEAAPALAKSGLAEVLPDSLEKIQFAGAPLGDWLILAIRTALSLLVAWCIFALILLVLRVSVKDHKKSQGYQFAEAAFPPLTLYVAVVAVNLFTSKLQVAIVAREAIGRYATIVGWIAFVWFLWRLIDAVSDIWSARMARSQHRRAMSALLFARRSAKTLLVAVASVAILDTLGINVTTGIAALGLGGLALALGAQKTIENLVGSITVIADQPVRVGDFCKVGDVVGTVEEIGMRSTQIRTNERTVVTIPNGTFSSQQIENFSSRDRFLFDPVIGVTYDVDATAMRALLEAIRMILEKDENVIDGARVRFTEFNASSLDIEIFAYLRTHDFAESLRMRETLLLNIMETVSAQGASIAFPTRTVVIAAP